MQFGWLRLLNVALAIREAMVLQRLKPLRIGLQSCLSAAVLVMTVATAGMAQRVVPKRQAVCPMGYVDTAKGTCSTLGLMTYTVEPLEGKACPSGWINVGGGYCRKK